MLVLPLGLGTHLRRLPIITLMISGIWLAVAALDRSGDRITEGLFDAVSTSGVRDAARDLFVQYCKHRHGDTRGCQKYSILVWTGFPHKGRKLEQGKGLPVDLPGMMKEFAQAEKLRKELSDCGASRRCFTYKDIIWGFLDRERRQSASFAGLGAYRHYAAAMRAYRGDLKQLCRLNLCLVRDNITIPSLLAAQARHGGAAHLLGNLIAFLIFGIYVEQRTSRLLYLAAVIVGGTVGMAVHAAFFGSGDSVALGGSANVSVVLGMFYVFFFHARMRLAVWLPLIWQPHLGWRSFAADVKWCVPLLFVLSDLAGGLDTGFADLAAQKVAHFAHLTGFLFGALAAFGIATWRRVPKPLLYEGELADLRALEMSRDLPQLLTRASGMARVNPDNVHALEVACAMALRWMQTSKLSQNPALYERIRGFLSAHLQTVCAVNARRGEFRYAGKLLTQVPLYLPYKVCLDRLGQVSTLQIADFALGEGHPLLALRMYDFFLSRFPLSLQCRRVEDTAADLIAHLTPSRESIQALTTFLTHHPDSPLAPRLGAWLSNIHLARQA